MKKLSKFHYMSFCSIHIFGILYLQGRMSTFNCVIYNLFPYFVEHSCNEYFIKSAFFPPPNIISSIYQSCMMDNCRNFFFSLGRNLINVSAINLIWNYQNKIQKHIFLGVIFWGVCMASFFGATLAVVAIATFWYKSSCCNCCYKIPL